MAYTKKETAIKNLIKGKYFDSSNFDNFRDDKDVVLEAVKANGYALQHASDSLKDDKEIVLQAVKQDGRSLRCASESIKSLCKNKDPIETLERAIKEDKINQFSNDLEKALSKSQSNNKPKLKL